MPLDFWKVTLSGHCSRQAARLSASTLAAPSLLWMFFGSSQRCKGVFLITWVWNGSISQTSPAMSETLLKIVTQWWNWLLRTSTAPTFMASLPSLRKIVFCKEDKTNQQFAAESSPHTASYSLSVVLTDLMTRSNIKSLTLAKKKSAAAVGLTFPCVSAGSTQNGPAQVVRSRTCESWWIDVGLCGKLEKPKKNPCGTALMILKQTTEIFIHCRACRWASWWMISPAY